MECYLNDIHSNNGRFIQETTVVNDIDIVHCWSFICLLISSLFERMLCLPPGMDHYEEMLSGAHFMDLHYLNTPLEQNVCHIVLHLLLLYMSSSPINVYNWY